ncbi:MAG: alkaline phosphatase D family protein [Microcoleaceae cyanobacterium]
MNEQPTTTLSNTLDPDKVFPLSVASGDPTENGVILWTRVNPDVYDETLPLEYEVSSDEEFNQTIVSGEVPAAQFSPERDYTVQIDLAEEGHLEANHIYYYRFKYKDTYSRTGRCRTLPAENGPDFNFLRLAVLTCNDYSSGYFNAFHRLADENVHFVIHLGDFAYEYPQYPEGYGEIYRTDIKLQDKEFVPDDPHKGSRATSLRDFRQIYRKYREDPALQSAMEKHTWIIILDDHEIADDAYWDYNNNALGAHPDHGIYQKYPQGTVKANEEMNKLYSNAMQAWTEYVPARWKKISAAEGGERGEHYKLYREFKFGRLVDLFLTDSRTYRDRPEGEEGTYYNPLTWKNTSNNNKMLEKLTDAKADNPNADTVELVKQFRKEQIPQMLQEAKAANPDTDLVKLVEQLCNKQMLEALKKAKAANPDTDLVKLVEQLCKNDSGEEAPKDWKWSMLGKDQKEWLVNGITQSQADWQLWGNQTLLATSDVVEMQAHDDWHGFKAERYEILQRIKDSHKNKEASRFVVFTGDMHTSLISYLKTSFEEDFDPFENQWSWNPLDLVNNSMNWSYPKLVGVEFMTPSVTAPGLAEGLPPGLEAWVKKKGGSVDDFFYNAPSTVVNTATSVGSSVFGAFKWAASAVTPDVVENIAGSAVDAVAGAASAAASGVSLSKHTLGNVIKAFSPHIEHLEPRINGYAVAEFTPNELTWSVYDIDKTKDDKDAEQKLVQSVKYDPNTINLHDWYDKLA